MIELGIFGANGRTDHKYRRNLPLFIYLVLQDLHQIVCQCFV